MGTREQLLTSATTCLYELGYSHTTARDIVAKAGVNLAAINYHYGSMHQLMTDALYRAIEDWSVTFVQAVTTGPMNAPGSRPHFEQVWQQLFESFADHRAIWAATVDITVQAERQQDVRDTLAGQLHDGRRWLAELFQGDAAPLDPAERQAVGVLHQALVSGLLIQWLLDRDALPEPVILARALQHITRTWPD